MPAIVDVSVLRRPGATFLLASTLLATSLVVPEAAAIETGPEVGETIPALDARDQHGDPRTFEDLRGPEGLLVLFYRTADW